jgi:hypothetical protein
MTLLLLLLLLPPLLLLLLLLRCWGAAVACRYSTQSERIDSVMSCSTSLLLPLLLPPLLLPPLLLLLLL